MAVIAGASAVLLASLLTLEAWKSVPADLSARAGYHRVSARAGRPGEGEAGELPQGFAALRLSYTVVYTLMMGT